jgi:tetratricopeptide (TPR) repeat protein
MTVHWAIVLLVAQSGGLVAQQGTCDRDLSQTLEKQARQSMAARDYGAAARRFAECLDACPENRGALLDLAQALTAGRRFDEAIRAAARYIEADPRPVAGHLALANAYLMSARFKEAIAESVGILKEHPNEPGAMKIKANAAYLAGDVETAKDALIQLLDTHSGDEDAAYMLGRIYYQEGNVDLAIGQFDRVLKADPGSYKALDNLGLCYEALGDRERAIRHFLAAIKLVEKDHPEYEWPYTNLAELLLKSGDAQPAFDAASKAVNRNPMSPRSFYIGAKALFELGKPELAVNWLQRSLSLDESSADSWYYLARVYRKLGKNDKAAEAEAKFREWKAREPRRHR